MRFSHIAAAFLALGTFMSFGSAKDAAKTAAPRASAKTVDLTKIGRVIAKEPAYQSKEQKYCLLVFGAEAKTRVWLVIDGDTLYVDCNGNGDLTEPGERVLIDLTGRFDVGDIIEQPGKTKHSSLRVYIHPKNPSSKTSSIRILSAGKYNQLCSPEYASRPAEAPIVHFNGPLTFKLDPPREVLYKNYAGYNIGPVGVLRRGRDAYLYGAMGTPGLGEQSFALYKSRDFVPKAGLTVEVEFPAQGQGQPPLLVRGVLAEFELEGHIRVPNKARLGDVSLKVSLPERKDVQGLPLTLPDIEIRD
jgi:hypothetical protein